MLCYETLEWPQFVTFRPLEPLSQWEVSSGDLELTRCKSTVKAICFGLVNSATFIRCKLHCERSKFFVSLLGGAAYAAVSHDFRSVLHLRCCQSSSLCRSWFQLRCRPYIIYGVSIYDNDEPCEQVVRGWNVVSDSCMARDVLVVPPRD